MGLVYLDSPFGTFILIDASLPPRDAEETIVHELLHVLDPDADELTIESATRTILGD